MVGKLRCEAGRGMFPHEAGVLIHGAEANYESMIDAELIDLEGAELGDSTSPAWIEVSVVKVNGSTMLVELPRQVVSGGRRIWVKKSDVVMR